MIILLFKNSLPVMGFGVYAIRKAAFFRDKENFPTDKEKPPTN
jgi:hypothetical protein